MRPAPPVSSRDVVTILSDQIGIRRAGSRQEAEAAELVGEFAAAAGAQVMTEHFDFRDWDGGDEEPDLVMLASGVHVPARLVPYSVPMASHVMEGRLRYDGKWAVIPQRTIVDRYLIVDAADRTVTWVLVDPYGEQRSLPNVNPLSSMPTVVVSQSDEHLLKAAAAHGDSVRATWPRTEESVRSSQNVVAEVGKGEHVMLVVAHLDSVPGSRGGNDNASGVATALGLLAWYSAHPMDGLRLRVIFSGAEEPFLAGSRIYASRAIPSEGVATFVGCLNLDMVAVGDRFVIKAEPESIWATGGVDAARSVSSIPVGVEPMMPTSDHWSFHEAGVPSAQLTRAPDDHWHRSTDTADRFDDVALEDASRVAEALVETYVAAWQHARRGWMDVSTQ